MGAGDKKNMIGGREVEESMVHILKGNKQKGTVSWVNVSS